MPVLSSYHTSFLRNDASALCFILRLGALLSIVAFCHGESVRLAWHPNPEPDIAGYKLHYWSQDYLTTEILDVGNQTSASVNNLAPATSYYFAVQAYNELGKKSRLSNPVSYTTKALWGLAVKSRAGISMPKHGGSVSLGFVNLGALSDTHTFSITNNGRNTLTKISYVLDGPGSANFLSTGHLPPGVAGQTSGVWAQKLEPGKSVTLSFVFRPVSDGLSRAVLRINAAETQDTLFTATLSANGSERFESWATRKGLSCGPFGNVDHDALNNLQEYAFGTDPKAPHGKLIEKSAGGLKRGAPNVRVSSSEDLDMREVHGLFGRRKDHHAVRLRYQPQFSSDLVNWVDANSPQVAEADDGEIEMISVEAPFIGGEPARFFRVGVAQQGLMSFSEWLHQHQAEGGIVENPNGVAFNNLQKYAFGAHPGNTHDTRVDEIDGLLASRGAPNVRVTTTPEFQFRGIFGRRIGHASLGLSYKPQFSADLKNWVDAENIPEKLADDGEIEVVSVLAPASIDGQPARFFRVGVEHRP